MNRFVLLSLIVGGLLRGSAADWSSEEFVQRRARMLKQLDTTSVVVMRAGDPKSRSNDVSFKYRQESNFLYLTGINAPGACLLLSPRGVGVNGGKAHVVLFKDASSGTSAGHDQGIPDGAVLPTERFEGIFQTSLSGTSTLYLSTPDLGFVNDWVNGKRMFLDRESRKSFEREHPGIKVKSVGPVIASLRQIKSREEVERIRHAVAITGDGLRRAMSVCHPGAREYELQAAVEYEMTRQGAAYQGFPSIVGSGENSLVLHYDENTSVMNAGDVVVMDVGAEYEGYSADVTRTLPVSGRFTREQRDIYDAVLVAQAKTIASIKAGRTFAQVEKAARDAFVARGLDRFIRHGVSHHVGLDVHDVGSIDTLRVGMVVTVEPGLYIPKTDTTIAAGYRGWGVRIEDDVLVTESGNEVLSDMIPRKAAEIESIMKKGRHQVVLPGK
jgi:Xaa-Pro aminopeptidase